MAHARFDEQGFETDSLAVAWGEVLTVGLRTTSDGPFAEDLFWQFALADRLIELPGSSLQGSALGSDDPSPPSATSVAGPLVQHSTVSPTAGSVDAARIPSTDADKS